MAKKTEKAPATKKRSQWLDVWARLRRNKVFMVSFIIIILLVLSAVFANVIAPYDPAEMDPSNRFAGMSLAHIMGTDNYGRDLFSRVIYGGRISLLVAVMAVLMGLFVGGLMGTTAGYFGGLYETIIMRFTDILMAIPSFLMALCVSVALGTGIVNTAIAIAASAIPSYARVTRASVLSEKNRQYVEAAVSVGTGHMSIIIKHILPNIISPILVESTLRIGASIVAISGLSFIGLGVQPPTPEWGSMMSSCLSYFRDTPTIVLFPGLAIMITIFAFNLFGDGLRDALDPRLKN
jgi:peptide/nickel transport system permease protein